MTVTITARQLVDFTRLPDNLAMTLAPALQEQANLHGINTNRRLRHFMATIAHESAGLKSMTESLNYSVEGLLATFGRHRISQADAQKFGRLPGRPAHQNAIANIIYGGEFGRKNLGNVNDGDGWRYRGRSPIMATGRVNYELLERLTGLRLVTNPDQASDPRCGAMIAAKWWASKGLNEVADADVGELVYTSVREHLQKNELDDMTAIRQRVNGGKIGLKDVEGWLLKAAIIWR